MKKLTTALLAAGLMSATFAAQAQEGPITGNVTLTTDYIYRGVSQTSGGPAIQGGFNWAGESGFYLGTWAPGRQASLLTTASRSIISVASQET